MRKLIILAVIAYGIMLGVVSFAHGMAQQVKAREVAQLSEGK